MLMRVWFSKVGLGRLTEFVMMLLLRLLTLVVRELVMLSSMLVVICLEFVVAGTLFFLTFIGSSLPFLVQLSIMMVVRVQFLILWSGLLVLVLKGGDWFMLFGTGLFCLGRQVFGVRSGFVFLHLLSVVMMLLIGLTLLVFWLNGFPFWVSLHWPVDGLDLGVGDISYVELLIFLNFGLARGCLWRRLSLGIFGMDVQFQCRLFRLVQALIFGAPVVSLGLL